MNRILLSVSISTLSVLSTASAETLSSNLDATVFFTEPVTGPTWIAAGFATGSGNYSLTSATLLLQQVTPGAAVLNLYSDSSGRPGVSQGSLVSPGSFSFSLTPTEFSGANLPLTADTTYWLVLHATSGNFNWGWTDNNTGSGVGFVRTWASSDNAGATWMASDIDPMMMAVQASPANGVAPEPGSFLLSATGTLFAIIVALFFHRFGKGISIAR